MGTTRLSDPKEMFPKIQKLTNKFIWHLFKGYFCQGMEYDFARAWKYLAELGKGVLNCLGMD